MNNIPHIVDTGASVMNKPVDKKLELKKRITVLYDLAYDDGFKAGMQRAVEMNVVKELTIEDIEGVFYEKCWYYDEDEKFDYYGFARAILRKAKEK